MEEKEKNLLFSLFSLSKSKLVTLEDSNEAEEQLFRRKESSPMYSGILSD